ncbi:MAG: aspartate/glutamate racemase family protein [Roseiflexaceae bacterium]
MKWIGLIGGMSWESSAEYYRVINELVRTQRGGLHSAQIMLASVDFAQIEAYQHRGEWDLAGQALAAVAQRLVAAGADMIVLCTNTMHKVAPAITAQLGVPFVHIADATAQRIVTHGITSIGLLGTRYTMEQDFYVGRLRDQYGLDVLVPDSDERADVNRIIYDELCLGVIDATSRQRYRDIMANLVRRGAQGIILGCTEITLLVDATDTTVPVFDTTRIHAEVAVELALTPSSM